MNSELLAFLRGSFHSVWSLELMLLLRRRRERSWTPDELVHELRGSRAVVDQSVAGLLAAGFILRDDDARVRYQPASAEIDRLARATADVYRRKPDSVRRVIISDYERKLRMLADAFRIKDEGE
jgi:hypothetical protein